MRKNPYLRRGLQRAGFTGGWLDGVALKVASRRRPRDRAGQCSCSPLLVVSLAAACSAPRPATPSLRFWAMGREGEVVTQLLPEFERTHPGIHVEVQQLPWTAAHEKLLTAFAGDATPDVCQLGNTWIPEFAALDALEPLDAIRRRVGDRRCRRDYFPGIWDTNVVDGALYGVPWYVDTRLLFYRRDLLAQAGFASPPRDVGGMDARCWPRSSATSAPIATRSCCRSTSSSRCWRSRCSRTSRCCATTGSAAISAAPASAARCASTPMLSTRAARRR